MSTSEASPSWPHVPIGKNNSLGEVRWRGDNAGKARKVLTPVKNSAEF